MSFIKKFTLYDLILIAGLSAIGLAIKPIINPIIHILSSSLRIPGGSLSGGLYMMWMVLAKIIIDKPGSALLFGIAQGLTVMLLGFFGSHGVFSLISYALPGVVIELLALFFKGHSLSVMAVYCVAANMTGSLIVAVIIMQLPFIPLMISLSSAFLSGLLGAWLSEIIMQKIKKYHILDFL
ncbi:MAG: ECF transporter S component [Candidatus Cloacimonetes bacterium]|jgi:energy-coupling factor transport system substrate-specific component|nr:ECF transporter S component [Candidatus Cloacimonadota bacterium]